MTTNRRELLTLLASMAALGSPGVAWGQQERVRRVGVLLLASQNDLQVRSEVEAFRNRLQELGWIDGRNVRTDTRWAAGNLDLLRDYAAELLSVKPDRLRGFGTPTVAALQQATRSVPIVFISANDPGGSGGDSSCWICLSWRA